MLPRPAAEDKGRLLREALRQAIHAKGLSLREVEQRLGLGKDYLRHLLSGRVDLKVKHALGVLEVLSLDPGTFFGEVYPPPARPAGEGPGAKAFAPGSRDPFEPASPERRHRSRSGAGWFLARKLREQGIFDDADVEAFVAELDREQEV